MMVDLPEPDGPTSAVTVPGGETEGNIVQHRFAGLVVEIDVLESDLAAHFADRDRAPRILILRPFAQHFARPLEAGQRFGNLRADADDLEDRRDQERQERREGDELAERQGAGQDLARADDT